MGADSHLAKKPASLSGQEDEITMLARNNPRAAMDMVIRKFRDRLFFHALSIVKDAEEAYDLVQEVFIRAIREKRFFDDGFQRKAWLFRVTTNLCFNTVRNRKRRRAILEANPQANSRKPDQVDRVFSGERQQVLLQAIEQMTEDHREILLLRYYNDLSYAEIGEVLGIKLGTVMSRLSRARGRLLGVMGEECSVRP